MQGFPRPSCINTRSELPLKSVFDFHSQEYGYKANSRKKYCQFHASVQSDKRRHASIRFRYSKKIIIIEMPEKCLNMCDHMGHLTEWYLSDGGSHLGGGGGGGGVAAGG